MQNRPHNPIQAKKQAVRRYSRNGVVSVAGGVVGGVALAFILTGNSFIWLTLGFVFAVVGGLYNYAQVRKIINE